MTEETLSGFNRPMIEHNAIRQKAIFWMVITTVLWGGSFVFNKIAFREIPPLTFLFLRFLLATGVMAIACKGRFRFLDSQTVRKGTLVGLALALANVSFVLGVNATTVSRSAFLNNLFVLLIPLTCFLLWRERVSGILFGGIGIAFGGLVCLAQGGLEGFNRGDLLSTVCAFFIAFHIIAVSKILRDEDVFLVTLVQFATVTVVGGVAAIFTSPFPTFGPAAAGALVYCAVFPTVICFTLQNKWQRYTTPSQAGLIYTLDPVWSTLGAFLLLGERLTSLEWAGCFLLLAGAVLPLALTRWAEARAGRVAEEVA